MIRFTGPAATPENRPGPSPYKDLHIYYIQGRLTKEEEAFGKYFLGNWQEDDFSFLFFSKPCGASVRRVLSARPDLTLLDKYHMTYEQWQGGKVTGFSTGRFFITPPWETAGVPRGKTGIVLDPGVVFGTGAHPTTLNCLAALDHLFEREPISSALDLGTGTGLLALAAARMGCRTTLAVDFNYLAAKTAGKNVRLNGLADRIAVVQGLAEDWISCQADLLISNIHYDIVKRLIDSEGFYTKKWFVLSGLLRSQARDIAHRLSGQPVEILKRWELDGIWHTFLGMVV